MHVQGYVFAGSFLRCGCSELLLWSLLLSIEMEDEGSVRHTREDGRTCPDDSLGGAPSREYVFQARVCCFVFVVYIIAISMDGMQTMYIASISKRFHPIFLTPLFADEMGDMPNVAVLQSNDHTPKTGITQFYLEGGN